MKRTGNLYDQICTEENIRAAILSASKGKREREPVKAVLDDLDNKVTELAAAFRAEAVPLHCYTPAVRTEGSKQKRREIHKPRFYPDQCVHWAIYNVMGPHLYRGFYQLTCGSVPGRGVHYGKLHIEKWIRTDRKNTRYYLKMDVHKFYPSIPNDKLKASLRRKFKDGRLLALLDRIIDQDKGLPIGMLLSQCFANYYLTPLDFYIKQDLRAAHYLRYMDDMVIFGPNKKKLHAMRRQVETWLNAAGLELNGKWQVCKLDKEPLDFMGFRFYRDHTTIRRSIMLRITRRVRRVDRKGKAATAKDAAAVLSYMGWVYATDSHALYVKWVKPYLHTQRLKAIVRRKSRERAAIANARQTAGERAGPCKNPALPRPREGPPQHNAADHPPGAKSKPKGQENPHQRRRRGAVLRGVDARSG